MTEQLDFGWVYNVSPLATFRMLTRLEHLQEKARHLGHTDYTVLELRERQGVFRSVTQRTADDILARGRPFSARHVLKETQRWQQPEWDGSRTVEIDLELSNAPLTITGAGGLSPVGSTGTRYALTLTIEGTSRPGRRSEADVAAALARSVEEEHKFRLMWLERQVPYGSL